MEEKRYYVNEDYPAETWESILGLTSEAACNILSEEEFRKWHAERNERYPNGNYQTADFWLSLKNLKNELTEAKEFYERHADRLGDKEEKAEEGSRLYHDIRESRCFNLGRVSAINEALEYIKTFLA